MAGQRRQNVDLLDLGEIVDDFVAHAASVMAILEKRYHRCLIGSDGLMPTERMLKFFAYDHLPEHLQAVSRHFADLAHHIEATLPAGPERTVSLRKLLEAKDAAVRAVIMPEA